MSKKKPDFNLLDHTADLGMAVRANSLEELFESAAIALTNLFVKQKGRASPKEVTIALTGQDLADTMVRWLGEILYLFEGERLIFIGVKHLALSPPGHLEAIISAAPFDPEQDEILHEIKAVTYHQSAVKQTNTGWEAKVIFDI
ncbi:MAG: archease [Deltaproteobacteria bacterium]|nr:archease [Deltaproteobacteria bacterium]MBW1929284.1 archease [Deltaproteobacteria bacterium]MBW2024761.1 archease [Deltaproteobacteria bacterium]MBW2126180.1 archease [Deltaproteobacteria bacterium]RLB18895.1 MAG: hypothetical protein DRG63_01775 [Deltaproteobacteria bacterium]